MSYIVFRRNSRGGVCVCVCMSSVVCLVFVCVPCPWLLREIKCMSFFSVTEKPLMLQNVNIFLKPHWYVELNQDQFSSKVLKLIFSFLLNYLCRIQEATTKFSNLTRHVHSSQAIRLASSNTTNNYA